jgi:hypothetical protein
VSGAGRPPGARLDEVLRAMPRLQTLSLSGAPINDETLAGLGRHASLEELDLSGTAVTDAALPRGELLKSPRPRLLRLGGTRVSRGAAGRILGREALTIDFGVAR